MSEHNPVNKPFHYNAHHSGIECIEVVRHMTFNVGNAIKYLWRAGLKGDAIEDLKKARWYIEDEIAKCEKEQAAGKFKGWGRNRVRVSEGLVNEELMRQTMKDRGVHLFGGGADEAPECYKKLDEVLAFHSDSIIVETRLTPIIVCMAGSDVRDPYKD